MGLELYLDLLSQPCRAIYIFAKKNRIPFELRTVDLRKGGRPAGVWGTERWGWGGEVRGAPPRASPEERNLGGCLGWGRATPQRCLCPGEPPAEGANLEGRGLHLDREVMLPVFLGEPVSPEMLATTLAELDMALQVLEGKFLQDKAFLTGSHISLADLVAITELMHPVGAGCQVFKGRPKLAAWRQRVEAAVGEVLFQEAHEVILKAKDSQPADPTLKQKMLPKVLAMIQ
ncbi:glutathione S-transferase theta-1 isoform X3 [Bos taurus]|uniref:glutathione S-transferase theta-1 isoform X3 n=1 Tax=Bos taurus TaxID=9913 RepID=UPI000572BC60|nr:glutathione S-transferase theta-1 isoform X3 [Bos taurus]